MTEYDKIVPALLKAVPEFRPTYEAERNTCAHWSGEDDLSADHVFDAPLCGFLSNLLRDDMSPADREVAKRAFAFVESLAASDHGALQSVVATPFCREMLATGLYARSLEFLGPATREFFEFMLRARE